MRVNGILLISFCDVCSAVSRSISWAPVTMPACGDSGVRVAPFF